MTNRTPKQILCCPGGCRFPSPGLCLAHDLRFNLGDGAKELRQLLAMPLPDRLTLVRALVPDGWVVAKVPKPKKQIRGMDETACGEHEPKDDSGGI